MEKIKKLGIVYVIILITISIVAVGVTSSLYQSLIETENEVKNISNELTEKNNIIENISSALMSTQKSLQENISELEKAQYGNRYETHDPTYYEAKRFMARDYTNLIKYDEEKFNCIDYATEVNNNAEKQGIRCYVVQLMFENSAHALICFNTSDEGKIYYEPQSDERVKHLNIGNDYWTDCVIPKGNYKYKNDPDDTIQRILVYW